MSKIKSFNIEILSLERKIVSSWIQFFLDQYHQKNLKKFKPILHIFASKLCKQPFVKPFNTPPPPPDVPVDIEKLKTDLLANESEFHWRKSYKSEVHVDSYEYLAFQEIPLFGAHFYYAYSPHEPIYEWKNVGKILDRKNIKIFKQIEKIADGLRNEETKSSKQSNRKLGSKSTTASNRRGQ